MGEYLVVYERLKKSANAESFCLASKISDPDSSQMKKLIFDLKCVLNCTTLTWLAKKTKPQ